MIDIDHRWCWAAWADPYRVFQLPHQVCLFSIGNPDEWFVCVPEGPGPFADCFTPVVQGTEEECERARLRMLGVPAP